MRSRIEYNEQYLIRDGHPWFPVMGEFHFSRYRADFWEESLRKMKAAGVSVVSAYVIWIHHEEEEGTFDFTGCRDLGGFLKACEEAGLEVLLRLGPFAHGEVRNGGLPDWLLSKPGIRVRSNDREYLRYAERYWRAVHGQVKEFLWENGGPVIGMQIENEYGHVGGLRGEEGEAHMRTLTALAEQIGFRLPIVTATGWGGACIGDLLPVMGGYCEAPWDKRVTELEPNANYVFSHTRNDALIASDYEMREAVTFEESKYPFLTAELGGGLQVSSHRRPIVSGKDIGAMSTVKLGSGVALLGYYMYHGGSNPEGKLTTLQESTDTGSYSDVPEINYDFQAPIRQFGTISDNLKEIKLLALFLQEWGEDIAVLPAEIKGNVAPGDLETLRLAWRHDENHGYVFFNNYVRRYQMAEHENVMLTGRRACNILFPPIQVHDGDYGFFPYGMKLGDAKLNYALATPLCRIRTEAENVWVFYGDWTQTCRSDFQESSGKWEGQESVAPVFSWEGEKRARILHLSREDARNAWKITLDREYLILSENFVWAENGRLRVVGEAYTRIRVFPALGGILPDGQCRACDTEDEWRYAGTAKSLLPEFRAVGQEGEFTVYERMVEEDKTICDIRNTARLEGEGAAEYEVCIDYEESRRARDILLTFVWGGDRMEVYAHGKKINDYFYTNGEDILSLRYFDFPDRLQIVVYELRENDQIFLERKPQFTNAGRVCELTSVRQEALFW